MADNAVGLATNEHLDQRGHRNRSSSLPPRTQRPERSSITRSRSTPPHQASALENSPEALPSNALLPPLRAHELTRHGDSGRDITQAQSIDEIHTQIIGDPPASPMMMSETAYPEHRDESLLHQENVDMPDAEASADIMLAIATPTSMDNAVQTQKADLLNYMQIDPSIEHSDESLRKMAAEIYGPPDSPELPLLQSIRRPASPPLQILGERPIQNGNAGSSLEVSLPLRPRPTAGVTNKAGSCILPNPVPNGSKLHTVNEQAKDDISLKRSTSVTGGPPAKKAKIEDSNISTLSIQSAEDDQVEILAVRPVRRLPKQSPKKDISLQPKKPPSKATSSTPASTGMVLPTPTPPTNWTRDDYAALARELYFAFPFEAFEYRYNKKKREVAHVFGAVIKAPLLGNTDLGDRRVSRRQLLDAMHQENKELLERDLQRERDQLRPSIEAEVWRKMHREGWVKLELAKDMLAETEKQVEELNAQASRGPGRRSSRVLSVEEATEELQAASAELEKAKKAEQRKAKRNEKKSVPTQGRGGKKGKLDDEGSSKPGPKPGYGKGKSI